MTDDKLATFERGSDGGKGDDPVTFKTSHFDIYNPGVHGLCSYSLQKSSPKECEKMTSLKANPSPHEDLCLATSLGRLDSSMKPTVPRVVAR